MGERRLGSSTARGSFLALLTLACCGGGDDGPPTGPEDAALADAAIDAPADAPTAIVDAAIDAPLDAATTCGDGMVDPGEQCDDGNLIPGDLCDNACMLVPGLPTAFRLSDLDLRDPHLFVDFLGCRDLTDTPLAGFSVNGELQTRIQTDGTSPPDGALDLSLATVFRPLAQGAPAVIMQLHYPRCTTPFAGTTCSRTPAASPMVPTIAASMATGTCLEPLAGTIRPYSPAITRTLGPCFRSGGVTLTLDLGGVPIRLRDARIAATYVGMPAGSTVNGLIAGFLSETDANNTIVPASLGLIGGQPVSSLFPGGTGNCAPHSDKDVNNGVQGWWFYLNFSAPRVTWIDN